MTRYLASILLDAVKDLPYLDNVSGLVQAVTRTVETPDGGMTDKRVPFGSDATYADYSKSSRAMIPNSKNSSMLFFEDRGTVIQGSPRTQYTSRLRLVCWLNVAKISGSYDHMTAARIAYELINRLENIGEPWNVGMMQAIRVKAENIPPQDASIFAGYDYDESATQYLMRPFDYFAIDLVISYRLQACDIVNPVNSSNC